MYMEGFKWTSADPSEVCLVFLFPTAVIDSPWKLTLACLGVIAISSTVEVTTLCRKRLPVKRQGDVGLACHAMSLILAYIAMLFVMTYSYEVCLCVIVGLILGHVITAKLSKGMQLAGTGAGTPCCKLASGLDVMSPSLDNNHRDSWTMVRLKVEGMTCEACSQAVQMALCSVEGVSAAVVSVGDKCAIVSCSPQVTRTALFSAVETVGFKATLLESQTSHSTAQTRDMHSAV